MSKIGRFSAVFVGLSRRFFEGAGLFCWGVHQRVKDIKSSWRGPSFWVVFRARLSCFSPRLALFKVSG